MSEKNIEKHQATFNMNDPEQKAAYEYLASFPNVSGKIKRLVFQDMEKKNVIPPTSYLQHFTPPQEEEPEQEPPVEKKEHQISKVALDSIL